MCQDCQIVEELFDLNIQKLFEDLARAKEEEKVRKPQVLSEKEKFFLCLSLLGVEPKGIAKIEVERKMWLPPDLNRRAQNRRAQNIRKTMAETINLYIRKLMISKGASSDRDRRPNWTEILKFLLNNDYKKQAQVRDKITIEIILAGPIDNSKIANLLERIKEVYNDSCHLKIIVQNNNEDDNNEQ